MNHIAQTNTERMSSTSANSSHENPRKLEINICVATSELPTILTKTRLLDKATNTVITKDDEGYSGGSIIKGTATNTTFTSMAQLALFLDNAPHNTALIASTHTAPTNTTGIMSTGYYERTGKPRGYITRTKDNFTRLPKTQGLLTLDCDAKGITKEQFLTAIKEVLPQLDELAYVYTTSSSSYLYNGDTLVQGDKGKRLYIAINDSSDIKRAGNNLFDRLWLNGHGHYEIGKAGQYLNRGIIDTAMFSDTSRLDFISGSNCKPPLRQARPPAIYNEGRPLDTCNELPELTATESRRLDSMQNVAKESLKQEAITARTEYCRARGLEHLLKSGISKPTKEQLDNAETSVLRALESDNLTGDFIITLADRRQVTVNEILNNTELYDKLETLDPLEPEYNNYHVTGKLFLDGNKPTLHSFAHGGKYYKLFKQAVFIKHNKGQTAVTTKATLEALRNIDAYYDYGKQMVTIKGGNIIAMNENLLSYELGDHLQYYIEKTDKAGNTTQSYIDPPQQVIKQILSMNSRVSNGKTQRGLKPLKAVITAPVITAENHIVYEQGYDEKTQLYLSLEGRINPPATKPTTDDVKGAYKAIMDVIATFKLNNAIDRSVVLSAMLTAVTRPALDKSPIFCFDAPTQGSGKTYLAECIGLIATGNPPAITPAIQGNEAEIQKTLLAMLLNGSRVIIFDNILGRFNSATLASFTTAINYSGRVLGASEQIELPNKAMVIFTGNNLDLHGDLPRRCITARIDTGEENPLNAKRDLSALAGLKPDQFIMSNRNELTMALITIIRAYLTSGNGKYSDTRVTSFENWDEVARQPILHLINTGLAGELRDIKESIDANIENDDEKVNLETLLDYLSIIFNDTAFTSKDLLNYIFDFTGQPNGPLGAEVAEFLSYITHKKMNELNSRTIGKLLAYRKGRIAGGKKIVIDDSGNKRAKRFKVVNV